MLTVPEHPGSHRTTARHGGGCNPWRPAAPERTIDRTERKERAMTASASHPPVPGRGQPLAGDAGATARMREAKRPRSVIAGPYGHPIHATMITVPIGAWTAAIVFDIVGLVGAAPDAFATGAFWLVVIGVIGALLAA